MRRPGVGAELRTQLSAAYDEWLGALVEPRAGLALAAVGALGRREAAPGSDLDLVLLYDGRRFEPAEIAPLADRIWYPIWDSKIALDHSVRTPEQAISVARTDLKAMLGLLDLRHVAGDADICDDVRARVLGAWRADALSRLDELRDLARARWELAGEAAYLLEPNLKESRGGTRDAQLVHALAAAQLVDYPGAVRSAYATLLDARGELHRITGRAEDVLHKQEHDAVAAALGYLDTDASSTAPGEQARDLMLRDVNDAARTVSGALDLALRRAERQKPAPGRRGWSPRGLLAGGRVAPPDAGTRVGRARDVVTQDDEVVLARDADPATDPGIVARVARVAAEQDLPIAPFTLERLVAQAAALPQPWPSAVRDDVLAVLGTGRPAIAVLESLDRAGLLVTMFPEWAAVRSRAQHNPVHRFTVDRHLLETAAAAAEHDAEVERRDLLLVAALLHDIGKGFPPADHSVVGAEHARVIAERMGLPAADTDIVVALVRHHLLLPNTATRRDPDDPKTISIVADALGNSTPLLDLLAVLAHADAMATGPAAWSDWKAALITDLVNRARGAMNGIHPPSTVPLDAERVGLAEAGELAVIVRPGEVVVCAPDDVGTLYRTTGVLALHLLDIRDASIRTHRGMAVNRFTVAPRFGRMPDATLVRMDLALALRGELGLAGKLADKERTYSRRGPGAERRVPTVHWFDDATAATVLEFRGHDEIGLLYRITAALERAGLNVASARISSVAGVVVDAFYLTDAHGEQIAAAVRPELEQVLLNAWVG